MSLKKPLDYALNRPIGRNNSFLSRFFKDPVMIFFVIISLIFGFFMLYSASGQSESMLTRQIIYALIGLGIMFSISQLDPRSYQSFLIHLFWFGLFLLLYVLIFPAEGFTTRRWIDMGLFSFQPSEVVRLIFPQ